MRKLALACTVAAATLLASAAGADDVRQASRHFQRGVQLYGEADYRAALVEFRRAYTLAPNPAVLYNVGETQYQLQDYAGALTTFERFLAETVPGDGHRTEVESDIEVLRTRVGRITIVTVPPGADLVVDDQPSGKTPLDRALLVSVGHRKVVATMAGRAAVTRWVDVAADDNVTVTLQLPDATQGSATASGPQRETSGADRDDHANSGATWRLVGWATAGALAAGAVTSGVLAEHASSDLTHARNTYPVSNATLSHDASLVSTYSILADSLTAAALVVGGLTLFSTITSSSSGPPTRGSTGTTRVVLGPASARFEATF